MVPLRTGMMIEDLRRLDKMLGAEGGWLMVGEWGMRLLLSGVSAIISKSLCCIDLKRYQL